MNEYENKFLKKRIISIKFYYKKFFLKKYKKCCLLFQILKIQII
jgi:hypothetical protein